MYNIIDNFLPESEFKEMKEWANSQPFPSQQDWSPYLTEGENVNIKKPSVGRDIHFFQENKMDDKCIVYFQKKLFDLLNKDDDRDERKIPYGEFKSHLYKYEYGSGILMHKDHSIKSDARRYGISFYLNDEWNANWGGELIVYENNEPKDTIMPKRNRLAIVNGNYHKVSPNLNQSVDRLTLQTFVVKKEK
jgi:Rps23 Pro-64 3,4-dihydroxylase Tpa1-like proline 4-hydroxylase